MTSLAPTNAEIYAQIGTALGISATYASLPSRTQADFDRMIRAGRRKFFTAYPWSFLEHDYPIVTTPVASVTGVCVDGVITTSGSTLPASMAGNFKVAPQTSGGLYDVSAQSGTIVGSTITLVNTAAANDFASQTVKLYQFRYALPTNWSAFIDPIVVENWSTTTQLSEYGTIPEFQLRGTLNGTNVVTGPPEVFSVTHDVGSETGIVTPYLLVYPLMETSYTLRTRVRIMPGDALTDATGFAHSSDVVMHPNFSECLMEAILASAEIMYGKPQKDHVAAYNNLLPLAIQMDKRMRGTRKLLPRDMDVDYRSRERILIQQATVTVTPIS